jgi:hypothetical protein
VVPEQRQERAGAGGGCVVNKIAVIALVLAGD